MQKLKHRFGDDGAFWMSYDDLLKKFQVFDRTRLFHEDWKVTQQWTSITVPWTVDYNDTKFTFTLEKKAPVVIVLSQVRILPLKKLRIFLTKLISLTLAISAGLKDNTALNSPSKSSKQERTNT